MFLWLIILSVFSAHAHGSRCPVYLTVSTSSLTSSDSNLVVNWGPECQQPPTWIGVYDDNPYLTESPPVHYEDSSKRQFGRIETKVKLGQLKLPHKWDPSTEFAEYLEELEGQRCLNFYILSYNQTNHVISFGCLKIQPQWMTEMKHIENIPLKEIYIPGTKCAGCYMTKANARISYLKRVGFAQNFHIWNQLIFGVRYLDFSVGYFKHPFAIGLLSSLTVSANRDKSSEECLLTANKAKSSEEFLLTKKNFWVMNGINRISPLFPILEEIKRFAELSKEVIILDFSSFPIGFSTHPENRKLFEKYLYETLGAIAFRNPQNGLQSFDLTIQQLKNSSKYLLITYNNSSELEGSDASILWPQWKRNSLKFKKISEVSHTMRDIFKQKYKSSDENYGWVLDATQSQEMAFIDDFDKSSTTTRDIAERINKKIMPSLGGSWSEKANVILLDFIFSTNLVDISLYVNQQKGNINLQNFTIDL